MRTSLLISLIAVTMALPAFTQTPQDTLNVVGHIPLKGEPLGKQIVFFFDRPITVDPAPDGAPVSVLQIDPPLDGSQQIGPNYVAYTATEDATQMVYAVSLAPTLRAEDGKPLNPEHRQFRFVTQRLTMTTILAVEARPDANVYSIVFSHLVLPEKLNLSVISPEGAPITPLAIEAGTSPEQIRLIMPATTPPKSKVVLAPQSTDASGELVTREESRLSLPDPLTFKVEGITGISRESSLDACISFTMPVAGQALRNYLTVIDKRSGEGLTYTLVGEEVALKKRQVLVKAPETVSRIEFRVAAGLPAESGVTLPVAYEKTLDYIHSSIDDHHGETSNPILTISDSWWHNDWQNPENGLLLTVRISPAPTEAELKDAITIDPPIDNMKLQTDDDYVKIAGEWASNRKYDITFKLATGTQRLTTQSETVPEYAGFDRPQDWYFPRRTGLTLPLKTRNIEKPTVILHRLFPSNAALAAMTFGDQNAGNDILQWCEEVSRTEVPVPYAADKFIKTPLDLDKLFPQDKRGLFVLETTGGGYNDDRLKLVVWTDLGAVAYWRNTELALFVHNLQSLAPINLASVAVYSRKNQLLGSGYTDAEGIAHLGPFNPALGTPHVAVIEQGGDYTLLKLEPRPEDQTGIPEDMPPFDAKAYDAYIYADRDLYRPGETVHARWLVRTNYGDAAPEMPLVVTVIKPNGLPLLTDTATLSGFGAGSRDIETQKAYPTGKYTLQLSVPASKKVIGAYQFSLEEFVPNRIKVAVTADSPRFAAGEEHKIDVNAQHLFGAPAADRKAEAIVLLKRDSVTFEQWPGFTFGNDSEYLPEPIPCGEAQTDAAGNASFLFNYQPPAKLTFPTKAIVVGRVFELGGRPVVSKTDATYFPSPVALGLAVSKAADGGYQVDAAAVTPDGQPAALANVQVTLERQVWNYYVRRYYDHNEPKWSESFQPVETKECALTAGRGAVTLPRTSYGYYRIRVHSADTQQYSTVSFYSYGDGFNLVEPSRPSIIKVIPDKQRYNVGEEASVRIESPFDGQAIVVVQGESIQHVIPVKIENQVGLARVPLTREQVPNVWLEVTVVHTVQADKRAVYPFSSFAAKMLTVDDPARALQVAFTNLPEEMRPASEGKFEIDVRDNAGNPVAAELTLAAVDEGIHGISGYRSPDPLAFLMRPRKPDLNRAHYYDKVAYDFMAVSPGGDALMRDLMKRAATPGDNWIKPVALWSGTITTDASGHATVTFPLPEFNGQVRLDAVACSTTASGAVSANMYVRRPYIFQASMPRFLLPGDAVQCHATLFNNTDAPCKATVAWSVTGAMAAGSGSQALDVPPHGEASCLAPFTAGNAPGQGEIQWNIALTDPAGQPLDQLTQTAPIPVRTSAAYQSQHQFVILQPGETREFRYVNFIENEEAELELVASASPFLRLQESMRYLVHYPYGCVEQTTSTLMPMYLLRQVWEVTGKMAAMDKPIDSYIQSGINRLFSMQTANGGFAAWPGGTTTYDYGSVYAFHFLTLVNNGRDFPLPEQNYDSLRKYVRKLALEWNNEDHGDLYLRAYAVYALAIGGDAEAIRQIPRFDTVTLPSQARYLLAAALAQQTADTDRVKAYLATAPSEKVDDRYIAGTLNSQIRNIAVELLALRQMKLDPELQAEKAQLLLQFLEAHRYGTTQENAFVITALAGYLADSAANIDSGAATIDTPAGQEAISGSKVYAATQKGAGAMFRVANTGAIPLHINLTTRGIPTTPVPAASTGGLTLTRRLVTAAGNPVDAPAFQQAASYVVDITIKSVNSLENIIVADLLPAGFEVENPRLKPETLPQLSQVALATPAHVDIRDDRVLLAFDKIEAGKSHYRYIVRAVTPGTYQYPAIQGECMYDASINSRSEIGAMKVE